MNTVRIARIRNEYAKKEAVRLSSCLMENGIRCVLLKGPFLNEITCGSRMKISNDLDILVAESDLQRAWELLCERYIPDRDSQYYIDCVHANDCKSFGVNHLATLYPGGSNPLSLPVELHYALSPSYYGDFGEEAGQYNLKDFDVFLFIEGLEYQGNQLLVLNPTLQFWLLLLHFSSHFITGLRDHLMQEKPLTVFPERLEEIRRYWFAKQTEIDLSQLMDWAERWNRIPQTLLPLHLLGDNVPKDNKAKQSPKGCDFVRRILPQLLELPADDFTQEAFPTAFSKLVHNQWHGKTIPFDEEYIFPVLELIGLRYHQQPSGYEAKCRMKMVENVLKLDFFGVRTEPVEEDFAFQQQFELERGRPGIYLTLYTAEQLMKTYLYAFADGKLWCGDEKQPYSMEVPCTAVWEDEHIWLEIPLDQLGLQDAAWFGVTAAVSAFEPYFHQLRLEEYIRFSKP